MQQFEKLKEDNMHMQGKIWDLENRIRDLEYQLKRERERRGETDAHTEIVTNKTANTLVEKIMKDILKLSQEQIREIRTKWDNGEM